MKTSQIVYDICTAAWVSKMPYDRYHHVLSVAEHLGAKFEPSDKYTDELGCEEEPPMLITFPDRSTMIAISRAIFEYDREGAIAKDEVHED
jgi:hypothetical protein